jgi:hypothetical protein
MTDEELVEKAARALYRNNWGDEFTFEEDREHWIGQARAALAVFREHTAPTDDELLETHRNAVGQAMKKASERDGFASNMSRESIVAGLRAVAGFRRGAPAEPAVTDEMVERAATVYRDHWMPALAGLPLKGNWLAVTRAALEAALTESEKVAQ